MASTAAGTFDITMMPGPAELGGAVGRMELAKSFHGDLEGTGEGLLLSCGDSQNGEAGCVAIETVEGRLGGREGSFSLQQLASMHAGAQVLHYEVVPGSGRGALEGIVGTFHLTVETDGTHRYELEYEL